MSFAVDDTSPAILYTPFSDSLAAPNTELGWNPYFVSSGFASSQGQRGFGQSQHITARNGASLSISWHGTSIQLFGNTTQANFSLTLDAVQVPEAQINSNPANNLLASLNNLNDALHTLTLTAITPPLEDQDPPGSHLIVFDKAVVTSPPPANFSDLVFSERPIDSTNVQLDGQWIPIDSVAQSALRGDTASLTFSGISIRVLGTTSPDAANYSVVLDNTIYPSTSAKSSFTNPDTLLFFASGLTADTTHRLVVRNEGGGVLRLKSGGGFVAFAAGEPTSLPPNITSAFPSPPSSSSSPPSSTMQPANTNQPFARGTIAALILAGILGFIILSAVLFFFCVWRPRKRKRLERTEDVRWPREYEKSLSAVGGAGRRVSVKDANGGVLDISRHSRQHPRSHPNWDQYPNQDPTPLREMSKAFSAVGMGITSPTSCNDEEGESPVTTRSGYTRWKKDINRTSGLTLLGLKFLKSKSSSLDREEEAGNGKEKMSPISPRSGRSGGVGILSEIREDDERESSSFSNLRGRMSMIGKTSKKDKGKGKAKWSPPGFSFRLSSSSSNPNSRSRRATGTNEPEYEYHSTKPTDIGVDAGVSQKRQERDVESLSGLTSLSYASNSNLPHDVEMQGERDPPSYAASVLSPTTTTTTTTMTSSPPSLPRSITAEGQVAPLPSPSVQEAPRLIQGLHNYPRPPPPPPAAAIPPNTPPMSPNNQTMNLPPTNLPTIAKGSGGWSQSQNQSQRHILSIGGGLQGGLGGPPLSMKDALRGLSPRISKASRGYYAEEQEGEENVGRREGQAQGSSGVGDDKGVGRGSTTRALPPIPHQQQSQAPKTKAKVEVPKLQTTSLDEAGEGTKAPLPLLNVETASPFRVDFDPSALYAEPASKSQSQNLQPQRFKSRSSSSDAAGLGGEGSPSVIQSFAEAAVAVSPVATSPVTATEGEDTGEEMKAEAMKRQSKQSTTSRVHFEDDPTSSSEGVSGPGVEDNKDKGGESGKVDKGKEEKNVGRGKEADKEKERKKGFRLTPPSGQSPSSKKTTGTGTRSFLDFSSQPSSLHSRYTSDVEQQAQHPSPPGNGNGNGNGGRVWSMQLPGRNMATQLKSKWSNTTLQTQASNFTSSLSSYSGSSIAQPSPPPPPPPFPQPQNPNASPEPQNPYRHSEASNIFPFPLSIPPSPWLPEGFQGVEPSPRYMSPPVSLAGGGLSVPGSRGHQHHKGSGSGTGGAVSATGGGSSGPTRPRPITITAAATTEISAVNPSASVEPDTPSDSFPYSPSEVHFRTSLMSSSGDSRRSRDEDRDGDDDTGIVIEDEPMNEFGYPRRIYTFRERDQEQQPHSRSHLRSQAHPPLPSAPASASASTTVPNTPIPTPRSANVETSASTPALISLTPQRYVPRMQTQTQTHTPSVSVGTDIQLSQGQPQQQQPQPSSSIVQRIFGGGGSGGGSASASANTHSTTKSPLSSFLKPNFTSGS